MKRFLLSALLFLGFNLTSHAQDFIRVGTMGGALQDIANDIVVDPAGNTYVAGIFQDTADFDPSSGIYSLFSSGYGLFVSKLDEDGALAWARAVPYIHYSQETISLTIDAQGNLYVAGMFTGQVDFDPGQGTTILNSDDGHGFLLKLDNNGDFLSVKQVQGQIFAMALDDSSNMYLAGRYWDSLDADPGMGTHMLIGSGSFDAFVIKWDSSANFIWADNIAGPQEDMAVSLLCDSSHLYVLGSFGALCDLDPGTATTTENFDGAFLSRFSPDGSLDDIRVFQGLTLGYFGPSLTRDPMGNFLLAGASLGFSDLDPGSGLDTFSSSAPCPSIVKLDSAMDLVWAKRIVTTGIYGNSFSVTCDSTGNIYTVGMFSAPADFDPGPGTFYLTPSVSLLNGYYLKLDPSGSLLWAHQYEEEFNLAYSLTSDGSSIYSTGFFEGTIDFDPNSSVFNKTVAGIQDVYVLKLSSTTTSRALAPDPIAVSIYPNPSEGLINIAAKKQIRTLSVTDVLGRTVLKATPNATFYSVELDVPGVYLLSAEYVDGQRTTQRFVIN